MKKLLISLLVFAGVAKAIDEQGVPSVESHIFQTLDSDVQKFRDSRLTDYYRNVVFGFWQEEQKFAKQLAILYKNLFPAIRKINADNGAKALALTQEVLRLREAQADALMNVDSLLKSTHTVQDKK